MITRKSQNCENNFFTIKNRVINTVLSFSKFLKFLKWGTIKTVRKHDSQEISELLK